MSNLDKTPLRFVLQCTAALGLFATAGAYFFAGVELAGGVLVGAALACGNFWALSVLGARLISGGGGAGVSLLFGFKFLGLFGVIWVLAKTLPFDPMGLFAGLFLVVISIILSAAFGPATRRMQMGKQNG